MVRKIPDNPPVKQSATVPVSGQQTLHYSGPLPPPAAIKGYEEVLPGAADRILVMAEENQKHQIATQTKNQDHLIEMNLKNQQVLQKYALLGLIFGFVIALSGIVGGCFLAYHDKTKSGLTAIITTVGAIIAAFIKSSRNKNKKN